MFTVRPLLAAPLGAWLVLIPLKSGAQTPEAAPQASEAPRLTPEAPTVAPLTLEQAVTLASERNERALAAQQRAEASEARVARARAFFFPELTLTGTYTRQIGGAAASQPGQQQRGNGLGVTALARVTLFDARGFPLYRAARLEGEAAELEALEARRLVAFEAADAFLTTLGSQQVYDASVRRLEFARQSLQDARARAEAGLASINDVTRAELEVANAEVQLAEARGGAETSRLELGYLLVTPVEGPLALPEPLLNEASQPNEGLLALGPNAEERRLDVLSSRLRVQSLEASAREPMARLFPTLGVTGQYRVSSDSAVPGTQTGGFISLDLTWNLFDGGERYAERRERVALAKAAELEADARTRRVDVDIQRARVELSNAQAALRQSQLATEQARKNAEETGILYRQGLSTALAVADAALRLFEAEVSVARARYSLGVALLNLRAAVGLDPLGKEPQQ
jgi:outer membrane protein TolC